MRSGARHDQDTAYDLRSPFNASVLQRAANGPAGCLVCWVEDIARLYGIKDCAQQVIAAPLRVSEHAQALSGDWEQPCRWALCGQEASQRLEQQKVSPLQQQVEDAARLLQDASGSCQNLTVYAAGAAAPIGVLAALRVPQVRRIVLDSFLYRWQEVVTAKLPHWAIWPFEMILKYKDLPQLIAEATDRQFLLIDPRDVHGGAMDEAEVLRWYEPDLEHVRVRVAIGGTDVGAAVRDFLSQPAPAARQPVDPNLAIDGGRPVRSTALPCKQLGADWTGVAELRQLEAALATKTLFRHYGLGKPVQALTLEQMAREKFGCRFALGLTSGSAALFCAVAGLGLGPGDEVLVPGFSWFACVNSILLAGATPVFCDIDRSLNLDPADLERKITPRSKAIMVIHYQGTPARMAEIMQIARRHNLRVIEDTAQAIGASFGGKFLGTLGDVGTYSFQGNKVLCAGEGGLLVTNDEQIFERAVRFHDLGAFRPAFQEQLGHVPAGEEFVGSQFRLGELSAAVMVAQLRRLDWMLSRTRRVWHHVQQKVREQLPNFPFRESPDPNGDAGITVFFDTGSPQNRERFEQALAAENIAFGPTSAVINLLHRPYVAQARMPHPMQGPFAGQDQKTRFELSLVPNTDRLYLSYASVAIGPRFTLRDGDDIAAAIVKVAGALGIGM